MMKTVFTIICTFLICHATSIGKGIDFFHGSFEEAKVLAAKEGRLIFIDAFTTWCGPCKRMSATVFTHEDAGEFYNNTFINLKLDMEKGEGKEFQQKYRVNAFPTLLFLDPAGLIVHRVVGGTDVQGFVNLGKLAASKSTVSSTYDQEYEDGNREPAFMAKYIEAMAKGKRPVLTVANEYLSGQSDYSTPENLTVIYHATVEADSRVFELFVDNRKALTKIYGNDAMEEKVVLAADATVAKGIEFGTVQLLEEAMGKVKKYAPEKYKEYQYTAPLDFYSKIQGNAGYALGSFISRVYHLHRQQWAVCQLSSLFRQNSVRNSDW